MIRKLDLHVQAIFRGLAVAIMGFEYADRFLLIALSGWMGHRQLQVIE
jgi:hypothetical protein